MGEKNLGSQSGMTWGRACKSVGILYALTLLGFMIKFSAQMDGLVFQNIWQFVAVLTLPAIHMFWFAVIALAYLTYKKFHIAQSWSVLSMLGWVYVIYVVFRLISARSI